MTSILIYSKAKVVNLIALIDAFDNYHVIDVYPRIDMLLSLIEKDSPDILILNSSYAEFRMYRESFIKLKTKILMIASDVATSNIYEIFKYGVQGVIESKVTPFNLYEALNSLNSDLFYMTPIGAKYLIQSFKLSDSKILTVKEKQILALMKEGKTYSMIADELFLSGNTIRVHIQNIYSKLNVGCKAEALQIAKEFRII